MEQDIPNFQKSCRGAQSAWRGFYSQTLYIANRVLIDNDNYIYCPEDIEDLVVKKADEVIEAVQIKNIASDLSLSSLASTKSSKNADGFFKRMCSLHAQFSTFHHVRVVYFGSLGIELEKLEKNDPNAKQELMRKLIDNHGINKAEAEWLLSSIVFEKANIKKLENSVEEQIKSIVPVMAAPNLAQQLLIQYISKLSNSKGHTSRQLWQEEMHHIGTDISAIDGYYKEYNKSLVRMDELKLLKSPEQLQTEFSQGISAHPSHIRINLDFPSDEWLTKIQTAIALSGIAIVKGVSGQGKSTICYRYLMNTYPEEFIFCIRSITSIAQAENLVTALAGLVKHTDNIIIFIDVAPGETGWAFLLQELQARGLPVPILN